MRSIVHTIKRRKVNWIGHILRRNCFPKHVIEGEMEGREDEEEDVCSCYLTLRKREDTVNLKQKY